MAGGGAWMFTFSVTATAIAFPSLSTSVPGGGGTVTTIVGGGGSVTGGGVVVVVTGGTVVVVGVDGVAGVAGVAVVGVVVVGVAGAGAGVAVCTEMGFEIRVAVSGVRERTTPSCGPAAGRTRLATSCGTATGFACEVATTTCAPLGVGVASSWPTASRAPT